MSFKKLSYVLFVLVLGMFASCSSKDSKSSTNSITAFSLDGATGVITNTSATEGTIAVTLPFGTDLTALVATFTTTGASATVNGVVQESAVTANDFTGPVTYTVIAEDNTAKTYVVTVEVALSNYKKIVTYSILGATGIIEDTSNTEGTIDVTVPFNTIVTALVATFTTTGSSVTVGGVDQVSAVTANDFSGGSLRYLVTSGNGATRAYTVTVTVAESDEKTIDTFTIPTQVGDTTITDIGDTEGTITLTVPYATGLTDLVASFTISGSSVAVVATPQVSGVTQNTFTSPLDYRVTAADSSTRVYSVTITRAPASTDATLKTSSTVKGQILLGLGTPNASLASASGGTVTITSAKALDTTNLTTFITLFDKTNSAATVKVVKYADGAPTTGFATDTAYANQAITTLDFFIVRVTAEDLTTILYYKVVVTVTPPPPPPLVAIGDAYLGGIVAYILQAGDPGYDAGTQHGLIAATVDQSQSTSGIIWAIPLYQSTAVTGTDIILGSGSANTDKIIAQNGVGSTYAAGLAREYTDGVYHDWYLPSLNELIKLYDNRVAIGNFALFDEYWSSSESGANKAWSYRFWDASQLSDGKNLDGGMFYVYVRAVRSF